MPKKEVDKVNRTPAKYRKRKARTTDGKQNQRLKALEKLVYTALERKVKDWQNGTWTLSTTPRILNNNQMGNMNIVQGTGSSQRIGNDICLLNQTLRFTLTIPDGGDTFNQVRMIVVEPLDGKETLDLTDVLQYGDHTIYSSQQIMASPYRIKVDEANKGYKVHSDKVYELNVYGSRCVVGSIKIKYGKHGKKIQYPDNTVADPNQYPVNHNLHVMLCSDSGTVLHPGLTINVRSRFYDA